MYKQMRQNKKAMNSKAILKMTSCGFAKFCLTSLLTISIRVGRTMVHYVRGAFDRMAPALLGIYI